MQGKSSDLGRYFVRLNTPDNVDARLFCFPYAGGGISVFQSWPEKLLPHIELYALQLPGRESRFDESLLTDINDVIIKLCDPKVFKPTIPMIFFGHSLGALIAFELSRALRRRKWLEPCRLIASGATAPHLCHKKEKISKKPDHDFLNKVVGFGGLQDSVFKDEDWMSLILPIIRADLSVFESYHYYDESPFDFAVTTISGMSDAFCGSQEMVQWGCHTRLPSEHYQVSGGHFFIKESFLEVIEIVNRILKRRV